MKLFVTDIDDTLTVGEVVPESVREAFARLRGAGWDVMVATGRGWRSARGHMEAVGVTRPSILDNGCRIVSPEGRTLHATLMDDELAARVLRYAWGLPAELQVMGENGVLCRAGDPDTVAFYARFGPVRLLDGPAPPERILRVGLWVRPELLGGLERDLRARFGDEAEVSAGGRQYIDVQSPGVSKGSALDRALEHWPARPDLIVAAGDHRNDLELLRRADVAAAPVNACEDVLREADLLYPPAGQGGMKELIDLLLAGTLKNREGVLLNETE